MTLKNMSERNVARPVLYGTLASVLLLGVYFAVLSLVSGLGFAQNQFASFWYYVVSLAVGFGIQVGLFAHLRAALRQAQGKKVLVVSGVTSTGAMLACCAHYLANIAPLIATAGIITFITQYQVEFFWIGLAFNIGGIIYMIWKIQQFKHHTGQMV